MHIRRNDNTNRHSQNGKKIQYFKHIAYNNKFD